jgi:cell division protein FtsB
MSSTLFRKLLMSIVPFTLMGAVVLMAIFGDHGLVRRHELRQKTVEVQARIDQLELENSELDRQIQLIDHHPIGLERLVAEELLMAAPGATIYRFDGPSASE